MPSDTRFHGPNAGYVLELYERYRTDPASVDPETRAFFAQWSPEEALPTATPAPAIPVTIDLSTTPDIDMSKAHIGPTSPIDVTHTVAAARLIRYIRELGHLAARIDPLGSDPPGDPGLDAAIHDVNDADLALLPAHIVRGPLAAESRNALEGVQKLRSVYCGTIGYETDHVQVFEERAWIREAIESRRFFYGFDAGRKRELLERLTEAETFERYLHQTFVGQKRFSIEGCDMLIPMLDSIIRNAATGGVHEVVIGMAHRGRLNVLAHILGKSYSAILSEFLLAGRDAALSPEGRGAPGWVGDVKYHLGARRAFREAGIEQMPITLAPNPSHLEFVNPVVAGRARAAQETCDQAGAPLQNRHASLPILIHGDAAFPGQGIVAETLNLSNLAGYSTGGTIHIIVNNQIGFTTSPHEGRSTLYASDLAKGFEIPIVHVNADDVEGCIAVARMAYAYRERFGKDFLIDLVGYRRWGHNEGDEPAFTQPRMYAIIARHPTVREQWASKLIAEGVVSATEAEEMVRKVWDRLQQARSDAEAHPHFEDPPPLPPPGIARRTHTAVSAERLTALNEALLQWPPGFHVHPRLERMLERRRTALHMPGAIDWAHAEALAFASLLEEGIPIRLTGQDVERGTFSQRHLVLHDAQTDERWCALQALPQARASFAVYNSPLSEAAALGFEFGYSAHNPRALVIWEAQFGDFANGAQVIIDQFIVSARKKWGQTPALVTAAAPRLRRAGSGAFQRAPRTLSATRCRRQHPRGELYDGGAVLSPAATSGAAAEHRPAPADHHDAQESAAPPACWFVAARPQRRALPACDRRSAGARTSCRCGAPGALLRQNLRRSAQRQRYAADKRRRRGASRRVVLLPRGRIACSAARLSSPSGSRLVAGRTGKYGGMALRRTAPARTDRS
jgi:2-oxoglutarate dehydrogenase E1 component